MILTQSNIKPLTYCILYIMYRDTCKYLANFTCIFNSDVHFITRFQQFVKTGLFMSPCRNHFRTYRTPVMT